MNKLPAVYKPVRGPRPIDCACSTCGAGPGWLCRDLRRRQRGNATPQKLRPHPARRYPPDGAP